jgi:hypothetical protein
VTEIRAGKSSNVNDKRSPQARNQNRNPGLYPQKTKEQIGQQGKQQSRNVVRGRNKVAAYTTERANYDRAHGVTPPKAKATPGPRASTPLSHEQIRVQTKNPGLYPTRGKKK